MSWTIHKVIFDGEINLKSWGARAGQDSTSKSQSWSVRAGQFNTLLTQDTGENPKKSENVDENVE